MTTSLPSIAIIGTGSMGGAILGGLLSPAVRVSGGIYVTNYSEAKAAPLRRDGVVSLAEETSPGANLIAAASAQVVILAVKPARIAGVLAELADALDPESILISVAAGITIASMEAIVPVPVVRAMPNTPSVIGLGVTGISAGSRVSADQLAVASDVFGTVGSVLVVPEDRIDALSTISGSGPAYVFYLIEELTRTAVGLGFSADEAHQLVVGTFRGAAQLVATSDVDPAELRRRVTSPNGTTQRAIGVLEQADLTGLFDRATAAALARARELAAGT